ncbi:unnamed protein product [Symbiodinium sp. CCMP2456]|nr:unnamed protein product [Symbiodinium sp. CCMP2456]
MVRDAGEATQEEKRRRLTEMGLRSGFHVQVLSAAAGDAADEDTARALTTQQIDDHVTSPSVSGGAQGDLTPLYSLSDSQRTEPGVLPELKNVGSGVKQEEAAPAAAPEPMQMVAAVPGAPLVKVEAMERALGLLAAAACNLAAGIVAQQLTAAHERVLERVEKKHEQEKVEAERRHEKELAMAVRLAKAEAENQLLRSQDTGLMQTVTQAAETATAVEIKEEGEAEQQDMADMRLQLCRISQHPPFKVFQVICHVAYAQVDDGPNLPVAVEKQFAQLQGERNLRAPLPGPASELLDLRASELPNYLELNTLESLDVEVPRKPWPKLISFSPGGSPTSLASTTFEIFDTASVPRCHSCERKAS